MSEIKQIIIIIIIKRCQLPCGLGFLHRNPCLIVFLVWCNIYGNLVVYKNKVIVDPKNIFEIQTHFVYFFPIVKVFCII